MAALNQPPENEQQKFIAQIFSAYSDLNPSEVKEKLLSLSVSGVKALFGLNLMHKDTDFRKCVLGIIKKEKWLGADYFHDASKNQYIKAFIDECVYGFNLQKIKAYLEAGADINLNVAPEFYPPLFNALLQGVGYKECIEWGADRHYIHKNGMTALSIAMNSKIKLSVKKDMLNYLVDCGVDLTIKNSNGATMFMIACETAPAFALEWLKKDKSLDLNVKDNDGCNALIYVITGYREYLVDDETEQYPNLLVALWKAGIDIHNLSKEGYSAIQTAEILEKPTLLNILRRFDEIEIVNKVVQDKNFSEPQNIKKPVL